MDKEMNRARQSNFELLRIISIIMIIMHHYSYYININCKEIGITLSNIVIDFFYIGGKIGVTIFFLIAGYFGIKSEFKVKKVIKLILEILFYSVTFFMINGVIKGFNNVDIQKEVIKSLFPITHSLYWFATTYIIVYILSPYINKLLNSLNKKEKRILILILIILIYLIPTIPGTNLGMTSSITVSIAIYILGAYIRMEHSNKKQDLNYLLGFFICIIFIYAIQLICEYKNISKYINYFASYNNIMVIITSICLFMYFKDIKIQSKFINVIASTTFGVYLIHANYFVNKFIWGNLLNVKKYYINNDYKIVVHAVFSIMSVYIICVLIDLLRIYCIEKYILPIIYKAYDKIAKKIKKIRIYERLEKT